MLTKVAGSGYIDASGNARCAVKHSLLYSSALAMRPQTDSDDEATDIVVKVTTSVKLLLRVKPRRSYRFPQPCIAR
jgi:hypothetical protein